MVVFLFMDKLPPSRSEQASSYNVIWNSKHNLPVAVLGEQLYLEPCCETNPAHFELLKLIFQDPGTMRFWGAGGGIRTDSEVYDSLKRLSKPWRDGRMTGAFIAMYKNKPIMLLGVGLFQSPGVGEFFVITAPDVRGAGLTTQGAGLLKKWALFVKSSNIKHFVDYTTMKKAPLNTIVATATEENIASIRVMLKNGFTPVKEIARYRNGFPQTASMFSVDSKIKGLPEGTLSIVYPTRYLKRKAFFELILRKAKD